MHSHCSSVSRCLAIAIFVPEGAKIDERGHSHCSKPRNQERSVFKQSLAMNGRIYSIRFEQGLKPM
jgi:hypothetical protein